jgi:predicted small secreted protein
MTSLVLALERGAGDVALKRLIGLLALLCLPALSACNTGADVEAGVSREGRTGTNQAEDAAVSSEGSGTIDSDAARARRAASIVAA